MSKALDQAVKDQCDRKFWEATDAAYAALRADPAAWAEIEQERRSMDGVVSDGTTTRIHRATGEALLVPTGNGGSWVGPITGSTGKWADDERVTDGPVVAAKRGNARGAKGPCCL
jgi:hypothetical protein